MAQIVTAMGGRVWIERSTEQGSVFVATAKVPNAFPTSTDIEKMLVPYPSLEGDFK